LAKAILVCAALVGQGLDLQGNLIAAALWGFVLFSHLLFPVFKLHQLSLAFRKLLLAL
jgi:hypothetical protein